MSFNSFLIIFSLLAFIFLRYFGAIFFAFSTVFRSFWAVFLATYSYPTAYAGAFVWPTIFGSFCWTGFAGGYSGILKSSLDPDSDSYFSKDYRSNAGLNISTGGYSTTFFLPRGMRLGCDFSVSTSSGNSKETSRDLLRA